MTKNEAAIITIYTGFLLGEFHDAHEYAEKLMGRPVYTHEFASKEFNTILRKKSKQDFVNLIIKDDKSSK